MRRKNAETPFPTEGQVAERLNVTAAEWAAIASVLEKDGLPRIDPLVGRRYWPAVLAYWNRRYGLSSVESVQIQDGKDNLDALK